MTIGKNFDTLNVRQTGKITAPGAISFDSSDKSVATIENDGTILGKKPGKTIITATGQNGAQTSTTVEVKYSFWQWILVILAFGWLWLPL